MICFSQISAEKEAVPVTEREAVVARQGVELKQADMNLIHQIDQLVQEQQCTLEKAGVPGFHSTTNAQELRVQMYLLEFIVKLSKDPSLNL